MTDPSIEVSQMDAVNRLGVAIKRIEKLTAALAWIYNRCPQIEPHPFDDMYGEETEKLHINQALWPIGQHALFALQEKK